MPQAKVGEHVANGDSLLLACRKAGVPYRTAHRWYYNPGIPEFHDYIRAVQEEKIAAYEAKFNRLISSALDMEQAALDGDIKADAPDAQLAHDILARTAYRIATLRAVNPGSLPGPGAQHRPLPQLPAPE